jgi:hypothetical protein
MGDLEIIDCKLQIDVTLTRHQRCSFEANFNSHPLAVTQSSKVKLVRYQQNPTPNWGPAARAESGIKRKRHDKDE